MLSKGLLLARPIGNLVPRRGKAVQNWKRPTMDEYLGPKEPWAKVKNKSITGLLLAAKISDGCPQGVHRYS